MKDDHYYEEEHFFHTRKEQRLAKKLASKLDRSQFKKTDLKKKQQQKNAEMISHDHLIPGVVLGIRGQEIVVQTDKGTYSCSLRGSFKKEKSASKTALIVGDRVFLEEHSDREGVIAAIEPRARILSRADHLSQKKEHFIAANVDLVFITTSVVDPPLRPTIIDRYLIAAEKGGLTAVIVVNKVDLLNDQTAAQRSLLQECEEVYRSIGIPLIKTSIQTGEGIEELKGWMKNKISVFSGQSGSGKSSLINTLCQLDLPVGKTVQRYKKGSHTTSFAQLLPLKEGGFVVDTPGIKSFGVWDLQKEEVKNYFHEIHNAGMNCQFTDCLHRGESGCAVPKEIVEGKISSRRYESYLHIVASIESDHLRR